MHNQQKRIDSLVGFVNYYRGNAALKFIFKNISLIYGHGAKFYAVTLKQLVWRTGSYPFSSVFLGSLGLQGYP